MTEDRLNYLKSLTKKETVTVAEYRELLDGVTEFLENRLNSLLFKYLVSMPSLIAKCPNCGRCGIIHDGEYSEDCIKCNGDGVINIKQGEPK